MRVNAVLAAVAVLALAACGGDGGGPDGDPTLSKCLSSWNASADKSYAQYLSPGTHALVFTFKGGECGVTFSAVELGDSGGGVATFVDRGGGFEPWLSTDPGPVVGSDAIAQAQALSQQASDSPNATISGDGNLELVSGAELASTDYTAEPKGESLGGESETQQTRADYAVDEETWNSFSIDRRTSAVAQFFADNQDICDETDLEAVADEIRAATFDVSDGVQAALREACTESAPAPQGEGDLEAPAEEWTNYDDTTKLALVTQFLDEQVCELEPSVEPDVLLGYVDDDVAAVGAGGSIKEYMLFFCSP
jgi:hypothetical protein